MIKHLLSILAACALAFAAAPAHADDYQNTINVFKKAVESAAFFNSAYGYAVFPTIGKGGAVVGGAYGKGRVYAKGKYVGDTSMTQLTAGFQLGGQAFSQIIFFEDERAFKLFTGGNFQFQGPKRQRWRSRPRPARRPTPPVRPRVPASARTMPRRLASTTKGWPPSLWRRAD